VVKHIDNVSYLVKNQERLKFFHMRLM